MTPTSSEPMAWLREPGEPGEPAAADLERAMVPTKAGALLAAEATAPGTADDRERTPERTQARSGDRGRRWDTRGGPRARAIPRLWSTHPQARRPAGASPPQRWRRPGPHPRRDRAAGGGPPRRAARSVGSRPALHECRIAADGARPGGALPVPGGAAGAHRRRRTPAGLAATLPFLHHLTGYDRSSLLVHRSRSGVVWGSPRTYTERKQRVMELVACPSGPINQNASRGSGSTDFSRG